MNSKKSFFLFSPWFMGVLFIVFAMAMAFATFFENDFGALAARKLVYDTWWFELILGLMIINLVGQIFSYRLYRKKKLTVFMFHLSFVLIILGAGITRYFGFEGTMHIREGEKQNQCISRDRFLHFTVKDLKGNVLDSASQKLTLTQVSWDDYRYTTRVGNTKLTLELADYKITPGGRGVIHFLLTHGMKKEDIYLWTGADSETKPVEKPLGEYFVVLHYQPRIITLPFSLMLRDFILEKYPGSSSPSSYKSNVILIDKDNNTRLPYSIYMNHILKYKGWRFYQSSYDNDEKGTILSVNKDRAGMMVTYAGYFSLFLFIILSLLNKNSLFRTVNRKFFHSGNTKVLLLLLGLSFTGLSAFSQENKLVVEKPVANEFGKLLVQDQKGRTKPLYTLSHDILRKLARKTEIDKYSPMQVFLGLYFDFEHWQHYPLIKISNQQIQEINGVSASYIAFSDVVDVKHNAYKLRPYVDRAYTKPASERNKFDKEVIKIDERLNICFMVSTGDFLKIFPVNDSLERWLNPNNAYQVISNREDSAFVRNIIPYIKTEIAAQNIESSKAIIGAIQKYQYQKAQYELPSEHQVKAEIFYHKAKIYEKLFPFYTVVGMVLLFFLIYQIIARKKQPRSIGPVFKLLLLAGFLFHALGLAVRWYVSGHAPMSNGYETMIFISWVTILAGFLFSRKSLFVLAATAVLGGFTLLVAHLSFMDPEITNLVPVLQSYWLTLHVSVITSSYGFLGLGAIIGLIVLILYSIASIHNKNEIISTIEELTVINYKSLTIGLYLLTIGTFLGAIWANESWGRYWGWDPKETWSLITIVVYSFIIHSRNIVGLRGLFAFNTMALFGLASVLMTYFGVNYYLSGLHSYAGGESVPVPAFVYWSVFIVLALTAFAFYKERKLNFR
ncbi:MAG: c-type cytochrome biogenesis protein CcsB [Bacteroidales bacterium]|jgi:cytochrome c-type biogenesis protein CcsB|nr:c-type cytochrome biogenesis protein CcsB [Bacteroidales bacterium]